MSDLCRHCGVVSRNACSTYKRKYLADELRRCPNLWGDVFGALVLAGVATDRDYEMERLREENESLRSRLR